jgi:hypothetical protein
MSGFVVAVGGKVGRGVLVEGARVAGESCIKVGKGVYLAASGSGRSQLLSSTAATMKIDIKRGATLGNADMRRRSIRIILH